MTQAGLAGIDHCRSESDQAPPVTAIDPETCNPRNGEAKKDEGEKKLPRPSPMLRRLTMSFYNNDNSNYEPAPSEPPPSYDSVDKQPAPVAGGAPAPPRPGQSRAPLPLELAALTALRGKRVILASGSPRRRQLLAQVRLQSPLTTPFPPRYRHTHPTTPCSATLPSSQISLADPGTSRPRRSASPTSKSSRPASPRTCPRASPPSNMCWRRRRGRR